MTERLISKEYILIKEETTAGVDSVPTSTNGIYLESLSVKPMNVKTVDRNTIRPFMGSAKKVAASMDGTFDAEIALSIGGNASGVPKPGATPAWDTLLRGCGIAKTTSATAIIGTAQGGTLNTIKLASGASATDDTYAGLAIATEIASGTAQAPGSTAKNLFKLASTDKEHGGTLQADSTTTELNFATTAEDEDDYYVGMTVVIGAESSVISAYNGTTKVATAVTPFGTAPGTVTYSVQRDDDYYKNMLATITHFAGTIVSAGVYTSTTNVIYLPKSVVGVNNVQGCNLKITTGAAPAETRRIVNYDVNTRRARLQTAVDTTPTNASTFVVSEQRDIIASDGSTKIATLKSSLKFVTTSSTAYTISDRRLVIEYNGTTKIATVTKPFAKRPTATTTYTFGPYCKYSPVSSSHISNSGYFYPDGVLHSFLYARGTGTLDFSAADIPKAKFTYTGLLDKYEDAEPPAFDVSAWVEPLPVNYANTRDLYIAGFTDAVMDKFSLDIGNEVVHLDCPGADIVRIKNRMSKGSISIWEPLPSEFNFYQEIQECNVRRFAFSHGPIGNQIVVFSKNVQLSNPAPSEKDGIIMLGMDLTFVPTADGSDWALILQ